MTIVGLGKSTKSKEEEITSKSEHIFFYVSQTDTSNGSVRSVINRKRREQIIEIKSTYKVYTPLLTKKNKIKTFYDNLNQ